MVHFLQEVLFKVYLKVIIQCKYGTLLISGVIQSLSQYIYTVTLSNTLLLQMFPELFCVNYHSLVHTLKKRIKGSLDSFP